MYSPYDTALGGGLPHSEIPGSKSARNSPGLIAACHVLHRLLIPRHPLNALFMLEFKFHVQRLLYTLINFIDILGGYL